jgi:NAD(P)-dependent dehydrogenase (short-subunit alcohol dehydrogenase family)
MLARGHGHIVVTSSLAAWRGLPGAAAYSAAKAALTAMMESLRIDLAPHGIDVTVISPGFVRTKPGKKGKPFQVGLEQAATRMARAIRARRRSYAFPLPLVLALGFGRLLPALLYDRLMRRRRPR